MGSSFYRALGRFLDFLARTFGMFLRHFGLKRLNLVEFQDFQASWTSISLSWVDLQYLECLGSEYSNAFFRHTFGSIIGFIFWPSNQKSVYHQIYHSHKNIQKHWSNWSSLPRLARVRAARRVHGRSRCIAGIVGLQTLTPGSSKRPDLHSDNWQLCSGNSTQKSGVWP